MNARKLTALLLLVSAVLWQQPALACGPFFDDPDFSFTLHPDIPLSKFAAGNIGVLKPTMARSYLVVAWRYLNGLPLSAAEQKAMLALWEQRLDNGSHESDRSIKAWSDMRSKLGVNVKADSTVYPEKSFNGKDSFFFYTNCPNAAFAFAIKTAQQVSTKFGAGSKELKDWAAAQDTVFCNCNGGIDDKAKIPLPIAATLNTSLKPYRDYQIASANFYAGNYDLARQGFEKIAQDADSSFKDLGAYLALRASVRKAVVSEKTDNSLLAQAEKQVKELLNDKSKASIHGALEDLLGFIRFKIDQQGRFTELAKALSGTAEADNAGNNLCDYTFLFDNLIGENIDMSKPDNDRSKANADAYKFIRQSGDLSDWVLSFQSKDADAAKHALSKWHETHKLPWLVAALTLADAKDPECRKLIEEARKVPKNSAAYQHLQYEIAAQLVEAEKNDDACKVIDSILADKTIELGPSARNAFAELRLPLSKDFSEFMRFALQHPASIDSGYEGIEMPVDYDKMAKAKTYKVFDPTFSASTSKFLNYAVPLSLLSSLQDNASLPAKLKADVLQSLWVRSFLLDDGNTLSSVSPKLKLAIASIAPLISAYEKAASPEEKAFAAAFMILRNPGMRPVITAGYGRRTELSKIDDYQDNWWQKDDLAAPAKRADQDGQDTNIDAVDYVDCLNQKQKSDAVAENKKIISTGLAPAVLCKDVLAFAKKDPQDPRIPEALSLAVKATHFGERDSSTTKLSKECFALLHSKYPKSPWTAKTKYFY